MNLLIILFLINFLRTLFIIVVIYYAIRFVTRYILPMLVDKGLKNMQQKMQDQQSQKQRSTRPPGEVTIEFNNRTGKNSNQTKGDYVDFEEVE
jgi:predicted membrane protein